MAHPMLRPDHIASDIAISEAPTKEAAQEQAIKRPRGLTLGSAITEAVTGPRLRSQRSFRSITSRGTTEERPSKRPFLDLASTGRSSSFGLLNGRRPSQPIESGLPRSHSFNFSAGVAPVFSPTSPPPTQDTFGLALQDSAGEQEVAYGRPTELQSPIEVNISKVVSREASPTEVGQAEIAAAVLGAPVIVDTGIARLNSRSIRKSKPSGPASRRPSYLQADVSSLGEFAQEHLLATFLQQAENKIIDWSIKIRTDPDVGIDEICRPEQDPSFDQLLAAMGHVVRARPNPMIERLIEWRDSYSKPGVMRKTDSFLSSHLSTMRSSAISTDYRSSSLLPNGEVSMADSETLIAGRRSSVAAYLFCRVLIELLRQTSFHAVGQLMLSRLQEIAYNNQLRSITYQVLDRFPLKHAQWTIATELLGALAVLDFEGVSTKFVSDLRMFHKDLSIKTSAKTPANKITELEAVHLMRSMRVLRLRSDNDKAWKQSCTFMKTIADLFSTVHGQAVKIAYCKLLHSILLPLATKVLTNFDDPDWKQAIGILHGRLSHLADKQNVNVFAQLAEKQAEKRKNPAEKSPRSKYWHVAFPASAILACVSPQDSFNRFWQQHIDKKQLDRLLRERHNRSHALKATCRLLWSYLQRTTDRPEVIKDSLRSVARIAFFSTGRNQNWSLDSDVAEPLIQLIRTIGYKSEDVCFETILFPLLNYDTLYERDAKDVKVDQIDVDKTTISIRAFLAVLGDLESKQAPAFPLRFDDELNPDGSSSFLQLTLARSRPPSRRPISLKAERLSKPISTTDFSETTKKYFSIFCNLLVKIALICEHTLTSQAGIEEKVSPMILSSKAPLSETLSFSKRAEELMSPSEDPRLFPELVEITVQALPRCLSGHTPHPFLNLLCSGTAHPDQAVASACATSLNSIARQGFGRLVVEQFSNFLVGFDSRIFAQLLDGNPRNSSGLDPTLKLYVELIHIWLREVQDVNLKNIRSTSSDTSVHNNPKSDASVWSQIDRIESQGLFFLSSPACRVRDYACQLLELVASFDLALQQDSPRVVGVLSDMALIKIKLKDDTLSSWERSVLERRIRQSSHRGAITDLCCNAGDNENQLWHKLYPSVIQACFEICPVAIAQTRESVCGRLSNMHGAIMSIEDRSRSHSHSYDGQTARQDRSNIMHSTTMTVTQWKLYLIFACITLTRTDNTIQLTLTQANHARTGSKSSQGAQEQISTAADLFPRIVPLLSASDPTIRAAVVAGLGSVNVNLLKTLLEALEAAGRSRADDPRTSTHHRSDSSPRRTPLSDQYVTEYVQVYKLTAHFLLLPEIRADEWILAHLAKYTRDLSMYLRQVDHTNDDHQRLRIAYCGLIQGLYSGVLMTPEPGRWMTFQTRRAAFILMEVWSDPSATRDAAGVNGDRPVRNNVEIGRSQTGPAWAHERAQLKIAAQNAMATLCAGPMRLITGNTLQEFNLDRMLGWIDSMLGAESDKTHAIAKRALKNIIMHNYTYAELLETVIERLYVASRAASAKWLEGYVDVISDVFMSSEAPVMPFWKILSALLFILGCDRSTVRMKSARLLRFFDERQRRGSKLQDLEISISDSTTAVNKKAHFEISQRLALQHSEHAFFIFSEYAKHFGKLDSDNQRSLVLSLLPWIKTIELQLDPAGGNAPGAITASSYMLLVNMLHLTMTYQNTLHHEIQALWQALATGPHAGNVKLILDFITSLILDRRDDMLVKAAKHIVVFLSSTPAGQKVIEFLLLQVNPRSMWEERGRGVNQPAGVEQFPFLAVPNPMSPAPSTTVGGRDGHSDMSLGHLSLILLVDLIVAPVILSADMTTLLLHTVLILWDHRLEVVRDQAREMLVHLIHELVISKLNDELSQKQLQSIEDFVELVRNHDPKVIWTYEDNDSRDSEFMLVQPMTLVITEVARIFSLAYPGMEEAWGRTTMSWSTICPVRHLACRSLQIYRCLLTPLDTAVVSELLSRLASSVGADEPITQSYTMDILRTLRTIILSIPSNNTKLLAPLFWTTWTCLSTINEIEFLEALDMLQALLEKVDLDDTDQVSALVNTKPADVDLERDTLVSLVTLGCRSALAMDRCLPVVGQLILFPAPSLIGDTKGLHLAVLAHLPRLAHSLHDERRSPSIIEAACALQKASMTKKSGFLAKVFEQFLDGSIKTGRELHERALEALRFFFFPAEEVATLTFLMGLLTNSNDWFKTEVLQMLEILIANIDLRKHEVLEQSADLVSPLLRLLQTNLAVPALKILDNFTAFHGSKLDSHQLDMSMTTATSPTDRKRYEKTQSLYGLPESSGWSIPMPAMRRETIRRSVLTIHSTFAGDAAPGTAERSAGDVEFYKEDRFFGSYFPERSVTMTADEAHLAETNVGELVNRLGTLDDFFEDTDGAETRSPYYSSLAHSRSHTPSYQTGYPRHAPHDSFSGVSASSSTNLTSSFSSVRREPVVMSPSAFSASQNDVTIRPDLQPRSVTSPPSINHPHHPSQQRPHIRTHSHVRSVSRSTSTHRTTPYASTGTLSEEKERGNGSDVLSEEDDATSNGRPSTSDGSFILEHGRNRSRVGRLTIAGGVRSGLRRLTGSAGGERRARALAERERREDSPEVPKVPEMWRREGNPRAE